LKQQQVQIIIIVSVGLCSNGMSVVEKKLFLKNRLPVLGGEANPGSFAFRLFSHSVTLPLSHRPHK
jgi:hypothetical protein